MEEIIQALQLKAELDVLRPIDKEQEDRIMQKFRLDWNYHSNHLEGNSLTYGETKALILFGVTAQGKPLKDTLEITGHNEAINWVLEMIQGDRPLTENFLRELHSLLLQDSYKESKNEKGDIVPRKISAGKYKTTPNHVQTVTGEIFYFATPEETPAKMTELLDWYKEKALEKEVNPILLAAEFHYKFIRIHPFDDGNGRTARILMNFILMKFGFPPVIIKTEDKANYFAALQFADAGNIEAFITYIAQNLNRSLEIMIAGANGEDIEEDDDLDKEIALLEQRLNHFRDKPIIYKTKYSILELINNSISNLKDRLEIDAQKFQKFYRKIDLKCIIYKNNEKIENILTDLNQVFGEEFDLLSLNSNSSLNFDNIFGFDILIEFNEFNKVGFEDFDFEIEIKFQLYDTEYLVEINEKEIFKKTYDVQLSILEINKIVKSEVKRHKEFIEQKIAEKEKNNP